MQASTGVDSLLVHRCRFVQIQPSAIVALALCNEEKRLAIGRDNGIIEIWNIENNFFQELVRP